MEFQPGHAPANTGEDRTRRSAAIFRSAACLAIVGALASIGWGAGRHGTSGIDVPAAGSSESGSVFAGRAAEHRKHVFDERRSHYEEARNARRARVAAKAELADR